MMGTLRKNAKYFLWVTLAAFLFGFIAVMGFEAIGDKSDNPDTIAKIDKEIITYTELGQVWSAKLQELYGQGIKVSEEREKELKKELLYNMIETRLKLKYAAKLGIITSDEEVAENLMSIPAFNTKEGQFDKQAYLYFLQNQRMQPQEFEEQQRQYITLVKLRNQIWAGIKFTDDELKMYFLKRQRSIKADYVYFNYKNYLGQINITTDKMKDYYALNKKTYEKPERVKASHILIQADASPTSPTGLTDEAAQKLASDILAKIKSGEDFAALAKKYSSDPGSGQNGGDLNWFGKGAMVPEFEKAAFALKKGEVSGLVKTQFGYHIIKVTDKDIGFTPTFDKVKDKVLAELQKKDGMDLMKKKAEKFAADCSGPEDFGKAAAANTITVRSLPYFTENTKDTGIDSDKFKDAIFDLNTGGVSGVIEGVSGYYIFRITGELPAKFDEAGYKKAADSLQDKLRNIKFDQVFKDMLSQLKKEAKIEVIDKNL